MSTDEYVLFFVVRLAIDGIRGSVKGISKQIGLHFDAVEIIQEKKKHRPQKTRMEQWTTHQNFSSAASFLTSFHAGSIFQKHPNN